MSQLNRMLLDGSLRLHLFLLQFHVNKVFLARCHIHYVTSAIHVLCILRFAVPPWAWILIAIGAGLVLLLVLYCCCKRCCCKKKKKKKGEKKPLKENAIDMSVKNMGNSYNREKVRAVLMCICIHCIVLLRLYIASVVIH